jgi:hypothetical protein
MMAMHAVLAVSSVSKTHICAQNYSQPFLVRSMIAYFCIIAKVLHRMLNESALLTAV